MNECQNRSDLDDCHCDMSKLMSSIPSEINLFPKEVVEKQYANSIETIMNLETIKSCEYLEYFVLHSIRQIGVCNLLKCFELSSQRLQRRILIQFLRSPIKDLTDSIVRLLIINISDLLNYISPLDPTLSDECILLFLLILRNNIVWKEMAKENNGDDLWKMFLNKNNKTIQRFTNEILEEGDKEGNIGISRIL